MKNITVELCIGCIEDLMAIKDLPIDRIELNSALELGGLTPSLGFLHQAKKLTSIPLHCMVRPHAHSFHYTQDEVEIMLMDAKNLLEHGADGIVFGFLHPDQTIDTETTQLMVDLIHSYGKEAIFHKAFDQTPDLFQSIQDCIQTRVDRILTEGGNHQGVIEHGLLTLQTLQKQYGSSIQILPGGGVRSHNVNHILLTTGCTQIHSSCKTTTTIDGLNCVKTDKEKVAQFLEQLYR